MTTPALHTFEELQQRYKADPSSMDKTWAMFFKAMGEQDSRAVQLCNTDMQFNSALCLWGGGVR
jgi:2-oxoglutarate dehydrogenase complex dehydrogenase (E1) component-like enzyme